MPYQSKVTLDPRHYPPELISLGISTFSIKPVQTTTNVDGKTSIIFECERAGMADEFANHLIAVRRHRK